MASTRWLLGDPAVPGEMAVESCPGHPSMSPAQLPIITGGTESQCHARPRCVLGSGWPRGHHHCSQANDPITNLHHEVLVPETQCPYEGWEAQRTLG